MTKREVKSGEEGGSEDNTERSQVGRDRTRERGESKNGRGR